MEVEVLINCGLLFAVVVWSYWLANDIGDFPVTLKRERTEYSCACEFWCQCNSNIFIFPFEGA